jgi:hypothetical protein
VALESEQSVDEVLALGTAGAKGPNSNDTNGGVNGTPGQSERDFNSRRSG